MKKVLIVAASMFLALPLAASAATISNPLFSNGDTSISATGGSTVSGTFTLTVGQFEACEVLRTWNDSQPFVDTSVIPPNGDSQLGYQEGTYTNVPFTVKVGPNTATVSAFAQCAGIYGGIHSISGADNVVVGPTNLGTIRIVSTGTTGSTTVGGTDALSQLSKEIADLMAKLSGPVTPPTPVVSPACTAFSAAMNGAVQGQSQKYAGAPNVKLQGFLLSQGESIPALAAGAAFGFYGVQTSAAVAAFNASNHCN